MDPLIVPGTLDSLESIRNYVAAAAAAARLDKKVTYRLCLAVDEIATNAIVHGYGGAGFQGVLKLYVEIDDTSLKVFLEDAGRPYDPRQTPSPDDIDLPLDQRRIGGLGVYLTLKGIDQFLYERTGELNRNIFVVNRKETR